MTQKISLTKAASLHVGALGQPVVTVADLGMFVYEIYRTRRYRGQIVQINESKATPSILKDCVNALVDIGILSAHRSFPSGKVFTILGKQDAPASDVACAVDPMAYVSHLSAMDYHGLTDRLPRVLHLSSPSAAAWRNAMQQRLEKLYPVTYAQYSDAKFPLLRKYELKQLDGTPVERHPVKLAQGAYRIVKSRTMRVSTLGRTFLDMLRHPEWCGGIIHVLDTYQQHARQYVDLILDEAEQHGTSIDKVRLGYVLDERCQLQHAKLDDWSRLAQRGGSRKLDHQEEYSPRYSERWSLSLNVPGLEGS